MSDEKKPEVKGDDQAWKQLATSKPKEGRVGYMGELPKPEAKADDDSS